MNKIILSYIIIIFIPLLASAQVNGVTHRIKSGPAVVKATSLKDGLLSFLDSKDEVCLAGKCTNMGHFNIIKYARGGDEYFAINTVRFNDGDDVILEILLDENDNHSQATQDMYMFTDTLLYPKNENIDFLIPQGKKMSLIYRGERFSKVSVGVNESCYTGFVETAKIADVIFKNETDDGCIDRYDNNLMIRRELYDDELPGIYQATISTYSEGKTLEEVVKFELVYDNDLLKVAYSAIQFADGSNAKIFINTILKYDKESKTFYYNERGHKFVYQLGAENTYEGSNGKRYKIVKIK
ncbi:hypothetical protein [Fulvivirga ligni]|uniref:hypothetical protein n=1 Tax=Fulvivirga ligni TaxID=2904246 RepID=UPI001F248B18|nr:hypothetical protein [Fulvivirga ligni]UII20494.1 hypothetical protein LVD16_21890 [Fulvivirga ligni]